MLSPQSSAVLRPAPWGRGAVREAAEASLSPGIPRRMASEPTEIKMGLPMQAPRRMGQRFSDAGLVSLGPTMALVKTPLSTAHRKAKSYCLESLCCCQLETSNREKICPRHFIFACFAVVFSIGVHVFSSPAECFGATPLLLPYLRLGCVFEASGWTTILVALARSPE